MFITYGLKAQEKRKETVKSSSFGLKKGFLNSKRKKKKNPKSKALLKSEKNDSERKEVSVFLHGTKDFKNLSIDSLLYNLQKDEIFELNDKGDLILTSTKDDIETIRPKHTSSSPANPLYMDQVQQAMKDNDPTLNFLNQSYSTIVS